jgi:hypothetical protein
VAFAVTLGVVAVAQIPGAGQTPAPAAKPAAKPYSPPRTVDGHPDFSGFWNQLTATPFERDKALGAKEFWTDAEFADLAMRLKRGDFERAGGGAQDEVYDRTVYGTDATTYPLASTKRTSLLIGPEGRFPPMLPEAVKRNAARAAAVKGHEWDSYEFVALGPRCILSAQQQLPLLPYNDINPMFQIIQGPGQVAIYLELNHDVRVIPTDGRPHISSSIRQLQGDSVGHWEGDTLVVDTTNFTDKSAYRGSSENLHIVEHWTRTSPDTIIYRATVEDPTTWATPFTFEVPWTLSKNKVYEYACQEGNNAPQLGLGGARAQEREAAQKNAK